MGADKLSYSYFIPLDNMNLFRYGVNYDYNYDFFIFFLLLISHFICIFVA